MLNGIRIACSRLEYNEFYNQNMIVEHVVKLEDLCNVDIAGELYIQREEKRVTRYDSNAF